MSSRRSESEDLDAFIWYDQSAKLGGFCFFFFYGRGLQVQLKSERTRTFAMKVVKKRHLTSAGQKDQARSEKVIMSRTRCRFVVR